MMVEHITKPQAAARQLDTAIRLYFNDDDKLAIQTLAWAAFGILIAYDKASNAGTVWGKVLRNRPDKESRRIANFLKHADRDHDAVLVDFSIMTPEWLLQFTVRLYEELAG